MLRKSAAFMAAAALATAPAAAQQSAASCIASAHGEALFVFLIPAALESLEKKCATALPDNAMLMSVSAEKKAAFAAASESAWPSARMAFDGDSDMAQISDDVLRPLMQEIMTAKLMEDIDAADCPTVNNFYATLEPLTPQQIGSIFVLLAAAGSEDDEPGGDGFNICKADLALRD